MAPMKTRLSKAQCAPRKRKQTARVPSRRRRGVLGSVALLRRPDPRSNAHPPAPLQRDMNHSDAVTQGEAQRAGRWPAARAGGHGAAGPTKGLYRARWRILRRRRFSLLCLFFFHLARMIWNGRREPQDRRRRRTRRCESSERWWSANGWENYMRANLVTPPLNHAEPAASSKGNTIETPNCTAGEV